jgi:uncharacterized protein (DUF433 family)
MPINTAFTPREVADLSGAPGRVIEKAIEERVLQVRRVRTGPGGGHARRRLPTQAVAYAVILTKLDLRLSTAHKKRLFLELARMKPSRIRKARIELAPAVEIDVGRLVGDAMIRAERYRAMRDAWIVVDEKIKGGTAVIRGTRVTVYSVLGRIEHGDSVEDVLADNPDLAREAVEAAIVYARTHPLMGRPGGRPWAKAA